MGVCWFSRVGGMQEAIQELLEPFETGSSMCKVYVETLHLDGNPVQGPRLAGLRKVAVTDAQHVGLLISALGKAQATRLQQLELRCKEDGDCGCDKNEPHFGPGISPSLVLAYHCPQVRSLASLSLLAGDRLWRLTLSGCRSVEVWPDFATMTSLEELDLSCTSLKEWPRGVQQLPLLEKLDIRGCWQMSAEEMIKAFTCKPFGYYTSACGIGSLASLLADLRDQTRRDPVSVADALDSRWPELVALFHGHWRYLGFPHHSLYSITKSEDFNPGRELCYLIRLMYELWFGVDKGEAEEAGSTYCAWADCVPTIKEKMKRLLCTETFMSFPFYVWRIGRTGQHALEMWEGHPWLGGYESYMAFALIGSASIGCFNASLNDDLKDRMVNIVLSFAEAQPQRAVEALDAIPVFDLYKFRDLQLTREAQERLAMRVGDAVCKMARAPSVAAALGQDFMDITMDGLKASYSDVHISEEEARERIFRWLNRTSTTDFEISRERCKRFWLVLRVWRKPSMAGEASMLHNGTRDDDDGVFGARVLHKMMLKIQSISFLLFRELLLKIVDDKSSRYL